MEEKQIVLFDGICNFCNGTVNFVIQRDRSDAFRFASLQSETAMALLKPFKMEGLTQNLESIVLLKQGKILLRSDAILEICKEIGGLWSLLYFFKCVPSFLRDPFYALFAKYRYRLFGKKEVCMIPKPEVRNKFLA